MSGTEQERFSLPTQATELGLAFFYSTYQARAFVGEFARVLQGLDYSFFVNIRFVLQQEQESLRAHIAENREEYRQWLIERGVAEADVDHVLNDNDRLALIASQDRRDAKRVFVDHLPFLLQTMLIRGYDAFYVYATELARSIYHSRVGALKAGDQDLVELVEHLTQRHVADISRSGQKPALYRELSAQLGLPWVQQGTESKREKRIAEMRHLFTHNRGIITDRFVSEVNDPEQFTVKDVCKPLQLHPDRVLDDLEFLHEVVKRVDAVAAAKYSLDCTPLPVALPEDEVVDQPVSQ